MTTGSYSMDSFQPEPNSGSWLGTKGSKSWAGADEPRAPRVSPEQYLIYREVYDPRTGKTRLRSYKIRRRGFTPKRAKKGEHAYSMSYLRLDQAPTVANGLTWPDMYLVSGFGIAVPWINTDALLDANSQIKLVNKLSEKLQGSDFNMSVFLGEGHQTLKLLADSAQRIFFAVKALRRGNVLLAAKHLFEGTRRRPQPRHDWLLPRNRGKTGWPTFKPAWDQANPALASKWLELQYGWLPLLKDAEGAAQSLAHHMEVPFRDTHRVSVRGERYKSDSVTFGATTVSAEWGAYWRRSLVARIAEQPSVAAKLGLLDPELVAWELFPFSFVADWFIPIGSWMEARAKAGRLVGTFITSDKRVAWVLNPSVNGVKSAGAYYSVTFDRTISSVLNVPMPEFKSLDKVASWQHCANAVALVTAMFGGKKVGSRGF